MACTDTLLRCRKQAAGAREGCLDSARSGASVRPFKLQQAAQRVLLGLPGLYLPLRPACCPSPTWKGQVSVQFDEATAHFDHPAPHSRFMRLRCVSLHAPGSGCSRPKGACGKSAEAGCSPTGGPRLSVCLHACPPAVQSRQAGPLSASHRHATAGVLEQSADTLRPSLPSPAALDPRPPPPPPAHHHPPTTTTTTTHPLTHARTTHAHYPSLAWH